MPYALLDDAYHANPKLIRAGWAARGLYSAALSYAAAYTTDGFIPGSWITGQADTKPLAKKLTDVAAWAPARAGQRFTLTASDGRDETLTVPEDGYIIPDYLEYNPSRRQLAERLAQKVEAGKRGARKRWQPDDDRHSESIAPAMAPPMAPAIAPAMAPAMAEPKPPARERRTRVPARERRAAPAPSPTPEEKEISSTAAGPTQAPAAEPDLTNRLRELDFGPDETAAALADPQRAWAWIHHAERHATGSVGGYAWTGIERGGWPSEPPPPPDEPDPERTAQILTRWVACPEAREYDEQGVRDEIGRRLRRARVELPEQRITALLDAWRGATETAETTA